MKLLSKLIIPSILASLCLLAAPAAVSAEPLSSKTGTVSQQKKAEQVQARIRANKSEEEQLIKAVENNNVGLAKQILIRNGVNPKDLNGIQLRGSVPKQGSNARSISCHITISCCPFFLEIDCRSSR